MRIHFRPRLLALRESSREKRGSAKLLSALSSRVAIAGLISTSIFFGVSATPNKAFSLLATHSAQAGVMYDCGDGSGEECDWDTDRYYARGWYEEEETLSDYYSSPQPAPAAQTSAPPCEIDPETNNCYPGGGDPCHDVTKANVAHDFIVPAFVIYRLVLHVHWCYNGQSLTRDPQFDCYWRDVDGAAIQTSSCNVNWYYYDYGGHSNGGAVVHGQATASNCVFRYGCWTSRTVNVTMYVHYDGTYHFSTNPPGGFEEAE